MMIALCASEFSKLDYSTSTIFEIRCAQSSAACFLIQFDSCLSTFAHVTRQI